MSILRFNRGGAFRDYSSEQLPISHALFGIGYSVYPPGIYRESAQIIYDVTTGAPFTKEELLALPFFYEGTLNRVPVEILHWSFAEQVEVNLTWDGLSFSHEMTAGYGYSEDPVNGFVRTPEEDYDRVRVYAVGDDFDTPSATFPQPSICMAAMRDNVTFDSSSIAEKAGTFLGGSVLSDLVEMPATITATAYDSDPGTDSGPLEVDTGIPIGEETYMLGYSRISDAWQKQIFFDLGLGGSYQDALYLSKYGVWAAPVAISARTITTVRSTLINRDATFEVLYLEHGETLDGIISGLIEEDSETITKAVPVGRGRFSFDSETPDDAVSGEITITSASVLKQFARFLPGQI
jgi:hypothetical protein